MSGVSESDDLVAQRSVDVVIIKDHIAAGVVVDDTERVRQ